MSNILKRNLKKNYKIQVRHRINRHICISFVIYFFRVFHFISYIVIRLIHDMNNFFKYCLYEFFISHNYLVPVEDTSKNKMAFCGMVCEG